jgi:formate hydrogenlyase subunit 3/multisubunit Na+/H+ antiporter MnhD subunit
MKILLLILISVMLCACAYCPDCDRIHDEQEQTGLLNLLFAIIMYGGIAAGVIVNLWEKRRK